MKQILSTLIVALSACSAFSQVQHADSLLFKPDSLSAQPEPASVIKGSLLLDSLNATFTAQDSLDIFELIDSLLKLEPIKIKSMMALRMGYNSNILADNRNFNISQFGLAPGISYYHKSGLYADVTSYWSSEYNPNLYLSVASGGYLHSFSKKYSLLAEYSHYFYNQPGDSTVSVPYTNNIGISNYLELKPLVLRLDYYLYFGDKTGHRFLPSIGLNFVKRKWLGLDRISFYPNVGIMLGTEQITTTEFYPNLLLRYLYNRNNSPKLPLTYVKNRTEFGIMNYWVTVPVSLSLKNWSLLLSYNYNVPKSLPGEDLSLQNSGFLSFSLTRYFDF